MKGREIDEYSPGERPILSNAEIAGRLASLAQLLSAQKENVYKVRAYRRAAAKIRTLSDGRAGTPSSRACFTASP